AFLQTADDVGQAPVGKLTGAVLLDDAYAGARRLVEIHRAAGELVRLQDVRDDVRVDRRSERALERSILGVRHVRADVTQQTIDRRVLPGRPEPIALQRAMLGALEAAAVATGTVLGVEAAPALGLRVGVDAVPHRTHALTRALRRLRADDDCRYEDERE